MRAREVRAPPVNSIVDLPDQILIMLSGELGYLAFCIPLTRRTVAGPAPLRIQARAMIDELPTADAGRGMHLQLTDIRGNIGDRLGIGEIVPACKMLHPQVPAAIVAVVHQLFGEDRRMLAGDSRHAAILSAGPERPMACRAGPEKLRATVQIRAAVQGVEQLLS